MKNRKTIYVFITVFFAVLFFIWDNYPLENVDSEAATTSLESMEKLVNNLTSREDFTKLIAPNEHQLITKYTEFKRRKINYQDLKGKKR